MSPVQRGGRGASWAGRLGVALLSVGAVVSATLYPAIVFFVMGALITLLIVYVYPRLMPIFTGYDISLPWPTRIVLGVGEFLRTQWMYAAAVVVSIVATVVLLYRTTGGRLVIDSMKLRIPISNLLKLN